MSWPKFLQKISNGKFRTKSGLILKFLSAPAKEKILRRAGYDSNLDVHVKDLVQRVVHDSTLGISYVASVKVSSKKKTQKRKGAREIKKAEILADEHDKLTDASATTYRALAARCNYLSQDRADISYASKELCRVFSSPSIKS